MISTVRIVPINECPIKTVMFQTTTDRGITTLIYSKGAAGDSWGGRYSSWADCAIADRHVKIYGSHARAIIEKFLKEFMPCMH